ncbi:NEDD8 activating enzyme [Exophiala xenobiotica]|uniref:NEDD8-activating enzyme E1 catalytic subunit n=1 Tax=Lithohypha guttulata TaxID=1690604 RepID=A0ABR0K8M6_9EURO|nr:NEDD8 activating enzyme [Lithohypha guttulata]KAK5312915.1 NEDD8 activating enzyme [Exophiala xenobiotica]
MATDTITNGTVSRARWQHLDTILATASPYADEDYVPGPNTVSALESSKILVIGAGGLGCELLKNLALSGFKDIHVIDMDTIDVSNLNRQFLFRQSDVGKSKAEVAAAFVEKRVPGVKITPYNGKIQDKDEEYYMQFKLIICGLDSIEARRWINSTLIDMVDESNPESLKPLIDGGTEGFKGQARVILPTLTSCIECQLSMHAPRAAVPLCTLATIPRQPQHCIEWAHIIAWPEQRKDDLLDMDDPEHVSWLYQKALTRAQEFNITGVTYAMTQGVVKNIIPAIASTNAIVAAACTNEALKLATDCAPFLSNYMMYTGDSESGLYTYTFEAEKKDDCPVCGQLAQNIAVDPVTTLEDFLGTLAERAEAQLKKPSIRTEGKSLYMRFPPGLEQSTRPNLSKKLEDLVSDGEEVGVSDPAFAIQFKFRLNFAK